METYKNSFKVEDKRLVSLSVYNVGYQCCEPLYQWGPGTRDHYLIHFVTKGAGHYIVNNCEYDLKEGDAFLIYPEVGVTYYADEEDPWEYYWVGFSGSDAPVMLAATSFTKENPVIHTQRNNKPEDATAEDRYTIQEHVKKIYACRGNTYESAVRMAGELYLMLAEFIKAANSNSGKQPADYTYVQKAADYIAMNYSYPLTVDSLADYVGISRSQLFREFKKYTGLSPKEYLTDLRIKKACSLLKNTSLSVKEVACSVGYDNSMYFSKVFSEAMGVVPSKWAENQ